MESGEFHRAVVIAESVFDTRSVPRSRYARAEKPAAEVLTYNGIVAVFKRRVCVEVYVRLTAYLTVGVIFALGFLVEIALRAYERGAVCSAPFKRLR